MSITRDAYRPEAGTPANITEFVKYRIRWWRESPSALQPYAWPPF